MGAGAAVATSREGTRGLEVGGHPPPRARTEPLVPSSDYLAPACQLSPKGGLPFLDPIPCSSLTSDGDSFIHSSIQPVFIENLLCAKHCSGDTAVPKRRCLLSRSFDCSWQKTVNIEYLLWRTCPASKEERECGRRKGSYWFTGRPC